MTHLKTEIKPDVVKGACDQKITSEEVVSLLENTFLKKV